MACADIVKCLAVALATMAASGASAEMLPVEIYEKGGGDIDRSGKYSIAEVVDASNKTPEATLFCVLESDGGKTWGEFKRSSLQAVEKLVKSNGARVFGDLDEIASFLNHA